MFLTDKKLERRIKDLKELRYRELLDLEYFLYKEDLSEEVAPKPPTDFSNWESIHKGAIWSGRDKYLWIHKNVSIPNDWEEKKIIGIFDYGSTGGGNNSGFESLLYINNVAFQAVDSNHTEVFIDKTGDISLTFRLWSGLEGGGIPRDIEHRINRCDLGWLDEYTDDLYYL